MKRSDQVASLEAKTHDIFDVIVIGGGATGAGIALDSVSRGYKTVLFEKSDFGSGTSSRSTKLVHGGVRYLAQGDILLVKEALHERGLILRNAPHLTSNQDFIIPVYSAFDVFLYTSGLKFYDLLSGRLSLGQSKFIGKEKTLGLLPGIREEGLKGGIVYHDGQFDDSRLNFELVNKASEFGAIVINYFTVSELTKNETGKITGVKALDNITGKLFSIRAKAVINATGVFANDVLKLDNPGARPILRPSQGIHLVLDRSFLPSGSALMIPKTDDGRVLFAIPWHNNIVVGTTDTPLDEISDEPLALEKEIDFILGTAERYFKKPPRRDDVLSVFSGLRPLASDPDNPHSTKEISRRHKILVSGSGLITITGGKWTTYRRMASETIERAIKEGFLGKSKCVTDNLVLNEKCTFTDFPELRQYGKEGREILKLIGEDNSLSEKIHPALPYMKAEIVWIIRNEAVVNIVDVLARRTRSLFLNARASIEAAEIVAKIMASELDFDKSWVVSQVKSFSQLANKYLVRTI